MRRRESRSLEGVKEIEETAGRDRAPESLPRRVDLQAAERDALQMQADGVNCRAAPGIHAGVRHIRQIQEPRKRMGCRSPAKAVR